MREYTYTAKNKEGDIIKGLVEADSESAAAKLLSAKNLVPVDILPKKKGFDFKLINIITVKDKALFVRQLATMINAGLPISQALSTLAEQTKNQKFKSILDSVTRDVEGGTQLSTAFTKHGNLFQSVELALLATGETSGTLDKNLLRLADQIEKRYRMNKKIRGAFTYPAFVVLVMMVVMIIMLVKVMPQMESLYDSFNIQLPLLTRFFLGLSRALTKYGYIFLLVFIASLFFLRNLLKSPKFRRAWDLFKLKAPIFKVFFIKVYLARFSRTLSGLIASGVPLLDCLKIVSDAVGNIIFKEILEVAREEVKAGIALSVSLKENNYIPLLFTQMISVGEKTGELDHMLDNLADYYEEEVDNMVKNFSTLLEPIIIIVIGIGVGTLIMAILQPIYGISNALLK